MPAFLAIYFIDKKIIITYLKEYVCFSDFLYLNYKTNIKINLFEYSKLTCRYIFKIILKTI